MQLYVQAATKMASFRQVVVPAECFNQISLGGVSITTLSGLINVKPTLQTKLLQIDSTFADSVAKGLKTKVVNGLQAAGMGTFMKSWESLLAFAKNFQMDPLGITSGYRR